MASESLLGRLGPHVDAVAYRPAEHGNYGVESVGAFGCGAQSVYPLRPHRLEHALKLRCRGVVAFVADYKAVVLNEVFYLALSGYV